MEGTTKVYKDRISRRIKNLSSACLWAVADVEETTTPNHLIIVDEDQDQHHGSLLTPQVLYSNFSYLKNQPYDKRQLLCHLHITYDLGSPHH
ncbi:hypothetical protein E1A91_A11G361800v1 [Gossypium mustelinum]|uniref:Uncharacterized protein n=1 Tax=Gossypium mustelinum TaxID=34275 RepID=A0A5D2XF29_GOSMU|nr:hypothetical protein E1A91_A11G361800v1 [Gossypium mustelinum]